MNKPYQTITFRRTVAPFNIEIGIHIPDDGYNMLDIDYVEIDEKRMQPVPNDLAVPLLASLSGLTNALAEVIVDMKEDN